MSEVNQLDDLMIESVRLVDDSIARAQSVVSELTDIRFKLASTSDSGDAVRLLAILALRLSKSVEHHWAIESCVIKAARLGSLQANE